MLVNLFLYYNFYIFIYTYGGGVVCGVLYIFLRYAAMCVVVVCVVYVVILETD